MVTALLVQLVSMPSLVMLTSVHPCVDSVEGLTAVMDSTCQGQMVVSFAAV